MRMIMILIGTALIAGSSAGEMTTCHVVQGVHKPVGDTRIDDVSKRDPSVVGKVFQVNKTTGELSGGSLFENVSDKVQVLKNEKDSFTVLSIDKHSDVRLLTIARFEGKTSFKYYMSWMGVFLTGECQN